MKKKAEKKEYSENTKRQTTQYPGVYQRRSEKTHGVMDTCFDVSYKKDGKKVWEKIGWASDGYTSKLANTIRADRIRAMQHGEELPKEKQKAPTFGEVAKKYLAWARDNKNRAGYDDRNRYENHLQHRFENKRLDEISPFHLEQMKSELTKAELSPATIKHCLVLARMIFNKAVLWGLWKGQNPVSSVKLPTLQNTRERFLSFDEANLLLSELSNVSMQLHDMTMLSLYTGMRAGEIFNLRRHDVDFNNNIITISDPKNKESRKTHMNEAIQRMLLTRLPKNTDDYFFTDRRHAGKVKEISQAFRKVIDDLGFNRGVKDPRQRVTFHTCRHSFASWLALQGESLLTIKELLGHKTLAMTMKYAHLQASEKKRAMQKLGEQFSQNGNKVINLTE